MPKSNELSVHILPVLYSDNLMPLFIECVESHMTLSEICNTLRKEWGEYAAEGF